MWLHLHESMAENGINSMMELVQKVYFLAAWLRFTIESSSEFKLRIIFYTIMYLFGHPNFILKEK